MAKRGRQNEPYGITTYYNIIRDGSDLNPDSDSWIHDNIDILVKVVDIMDIWFL